ncbi:MAG: phage head morphogenesis protein [Candidatus Gracilibacteria bacterium]|nr:phage head morphogenesis protein [Candidatus Gracilibacteria bacterium]
MLNEKIYNNFEEKFKILTSKNINKINQKINFGEENCYDKNIENNFISALNPHLEEIINLGKNLVNNEKITENSEKSKNNILGINKKVLGIWDENFPSFLTQNNSQNSDNNNENNKNIDEIFGGPKMEKLPEIINIFPENNQKILPNIRKYDENGFLKTPKMQLLSSKNNFQNNIQNLLSPNNSLEIAKNIYQNQIKYIEKIINKHKNKDNFLEIIGEKINNIINFKRNKIYCDCMINTLFHNNKTACFQAFLEENNLKGYKKRVTKNDSRVESICEYNGMQEFIPFEDNFISGHFSPPGHYGCRCHLEFKTEENLDFSIEKYILKTEKISELIEKNKKKKEQERREKEAEKEREVGGKYKFDIWILFREYMKLGKEELIGYRESWWLPWLTTRTWYLRNSAPGALLDVKRNKDFLDFVGPDKKVDLGGYRVPLSELGNFLIGYNAYYAGIDQNESNVYGLMTEIYVKGTTTEKLDDEMYDIKFYMEGYEFAKKQDNGEIIEQNEKQEVIKSLKKAKKNGERAKKKWQKLLENKKKKDEKDSKTKDK